MAYTGMTITQVSGGSITAADTSLTLSGNVTVDHLNDHIARTVTIQASSNGGTTWTNVGSFTLPAWDPPNQGNGAASQAWSGTITGLPASFANVNDGSYVFRAQMPRERDVTGTTLTSSTSAAVPVDTTADAAPTATLVFGDSLVNAAEASATPYTVSGLDADATAAITFTSSGGGSPVVANVSANGPGTVNLSGLADGTVSTSMTISDDASAGISDGSNTITRSGGTTTLDKVDEAPVAAPSGPFSVAENQEAGAVVGSVSAADPEGAGVSYRLAKSASGLPFAIDAATGEITTTAPLDREQRGSYTLEIEATDETGNTTPVSVAVSVADVDEPPAEGGLVIASIAEDEPVGTVVGAVSAADPEGEPLTYALATQGVPFEMDPDTGRVTTTAPLDHEDAPSYVLDFTASDGANTTTVRGAVLVSVTDVDEAPVFEPVEPLAVGENLEAGAAVGSVSATDPDGAAVTYALATENVPFAVNAETGAITATGPLDREATASYNLAVTATDASGNATSITVPVTVSDVDEPPVPGAAASFSVAEDVEAGTVVGSVSAVDPEGATLSYAPATEGVPFTVDAVSGVITTTAALDREQLASYTLAFTASDGTSATPLDALITVTNVDEAPVAGPVEPFSVAENAAAGAAVGTVTAADPEGAEVTYRLAKSASALPFAIDAETGAITTTAALDREAQGSYTLDVEATAGTHTTPISVDISVADVNEHPVPGEPVTVDIFENVEVGSVVGTLAMADPEGEALTYALTTQNVPFALSAVTGVITTTAPLDYETAASYVLDFSASDGINTTIFGPAIGIDVRNVNEAPVAGSPLAASIAEDVAIGTVVGTISATDPENSAGITYALTTENVPFAVNAVSGVITTTAALDREQLASYTLAFTASDGTSATPLDALITVTNVDEAPVAGPVEPFSVAENAAAGAAVGTVTAADPEGAEVTYRLAKSASALPFAIDAETGAITTTAALEAQGSYTLDVEATAGTHTTPISVAISVADVDEAPVAGDAVDADIAEDVAAGTVVGTVSATDPEGAALTYALATPDVPFAVDPSTGVITTTAALDRETAASYALAFTASDGTNTTPLSATVAVTDVDEAPVADPVPVEPLGVAENQEAGAVVGSVSAADPEGAGVSYSLAKSTSALPFAIDAATGEITTTAPLDHEALASYTLEVEAKDETGNTTPVSVAVSVADVDEPPAEGGLVIASIAEDEPVGTVVGAVSAADPEGEPLTYALATQGVPFEMDPDTGRVTTTAPLDHEDAPSYVLDFTASDGANTTTVRGAVLVSVTDVDEAPVFEPVEPLAVGENLEAGAAVGSVSATDPDGAAVTYALATENVPFAVNAETGAITATGPLDREATASYNLAVTATDASGNATSITVPVTVSDVDEPPVPGAAASFSVAEDVEAGTAVGSVSAVDPEGASVSYALLTDGLPFAVDFNTGRITTTAALDREQLASYTLNIEATDETGRDTPITVAVSVSDVDEAPVDSTTGPFAAIEGQAAGSEVGTVSATDPEGAAITFTIASGNDDGAFAVDEATGVVSTTEAFGFGDETSRALGIAASDGINGLTIPITVAIENVPDAPVFTAAQASVREDAATGTVLGRFSVENVGDAAVVFAGPSGQGYEVAEDGTVTLTAPLDFEAAQSLAVTATAAFNGASPDARSPEGSGQVAVVDVYENGAPGQDVPPAPVSILGGVASVGGTADGFKAVDGNLAYTGDNGTAVIPGVERAVYADGTLSFASDTQEAFLQRLYLGFLEREADGRGIAYHAERLESGATLGQIAQGFAESQEYIGNANGVPPSDRAFVEALYVNFLGRQADTEGADFWTGHLASGAATRGDIAAGFAWSAEAQGKYNAQTSRGVWVADWEDLELDALYIAGLGREADPGARAAATAALEAGTLTRNDLAQAIVNSVEYELRHGPDAAGAVNVIFRDALGREADQGARDFFTGAYNTQGAAAVLLAITGSAEFAAMEDPRASGDHLFT